MSRNAVYVSIAVLFNNKLNTPARKLCKIYKKCIKKQKKECVNAIFCFTNSKSGRVCSVGDTVLFSVLLIDFITVIVCRQLPGEGQNDSEETE